MNIWIWISEWLADSGQSRMLADGVVYGFSLLGLCLIPSMLGKWVWFFPGWFACLGVFLLLIPETVHPRNNFVIYLALSQGPWVVFALDLARGRLRPLLATISMRSLLAWSTFRFLSFHYIVMFESGTLPTMLAVPNATGELLTAIIGLGLWTFYLPDKGWYRLLLLFWNAYGLTSALGAVIRRILANPESPWRIFPADGFRTLMSLPQAWEGFFWSPISIAIHLVVFYKMYAERNFREMEPA